MKLPKLKEVRERSGLSQPGLRARLENAFPQLFDHEGLPDEQGLEEETRVILTDLGKTMAMEAGSLFEAMRETLTARELEQLCVGLYYSEVIRSQEATSRQPPEFREHKEESSHDLF